MTKSITYIGYSDDKYIEVVTGLPNDIAEIVKPTSTFLRRTRERRAGHSNVRIMFFTCEQYDLWLYAKNPAACSFSSYSERNNFISFRTLEGKLDGYLQYLRNHKSFEREEIIRAPGKPARLENRVD